MQASRGLIAVLVGTVVFFALWIVALKPSGSSSGAGGRPTQGLKGYQSDIAAAHQAVQTSNADNARAGGGPVTTAPAPAASASSAPVAKAAPAPAAHNAKARTHVAAPRTAVSSGTAASRLGTVQRAIRAHKVVAMLFYNPAAADDRAVRRELAAVPTHHGRVVKLTIPLSEISSYTAVTTQVPVNFSPTLVLLAPDGQADELVGFSDQFEIAQRVGQALAAK
jgi:hypothetical protein